MNASAPFRHFGLRARLNPGGGEDPKQIQAPPPVIVELPEILPHHRGGTTVTSVNGGVIAMICDVVVGLTIVGTGLPVRRGSGVGRLNIRMRRPIDGDSLRAAGFIQRIRRNLIYSRVEIRDALGTLCVDATGTVFRMRDIAPRAD
jgi:acyl-coenzyme A thioesterase PaaI-like protein